MNTLLGIGIAVGFCLFLIFPYLCAWFIFRRNEKLLQAHASDASGLGISSQEVCRRILDRDDLGNVTIYQNTRKSSYFDRKRRSAFLAPRLYDNNTISATSEASVLCGRIYYRTHPTLAHRVNNRVLSYTLMSALALNIYLFLERYHLAEQTQIIIAVLIFSLLFFWCSVTLRQQWLESAYGFERLNRILSNIEFNRKLYRGFTFKPYRQLIAGAITVLWSAFVLMG